MFDDVFDDKATTNTAVAAPSSPPKSSLFSGVFDDTPSSEIKPVAAQPVAPTKGMFDGVFDPDVAPAKPAPTKPVVPPMTRFAAPKAPAPLPSPVTAGFKEAGTQAKDYGLAFAKGGANIATSAGTIASFMRRKIGRPVDEFMSKIPGFGDVKPSPEDQDVMLLTAKNIQGWGKEREAFLDDMIKSRATTLPGKIMESVITSSPGMGASVVTGGPLASVLKTLGASIPLLRAAGPFIAKSPILRNILSAEAIGAAGVEGLQASGQNAAQTEDEIAKIPFDQLKNSAEFIRALSEIPVGSFTESQRMELARKRTAERAGDFVFVNTMPTTALIGLLTAGGAEASMLKGTVKKGIAGKIAPIVKEAAGEGMQSPMETTWQNAARILFGGSAEPLSTGVKESAAIGVGAGAIMAGPAGLGQPTEAGLADVPRGTVEASKPAPEAAVVPPEASKPSEPPPIPPQAKPASTVEPAPAPKVEKAAEMTPQRFVSDALKQRTKDVAMYRQRAQQERAAGREEMAQRYEGMADDYMSVPEAEFRRDVIDNPTYYLESNIDPFLRFKNREVNRARPPAPAPSVKAAELTPEGAQGPAPSEAISTSRKEASNAIQKGRKEQVQGTVGPDVQPSAGEAVLRTGRKVSGKEEGKAVEQPPAPATSEKAESVKPATKGKLVSLKIPGNFSYSPVQEVSGSMVSLAADTKHEYVAIKHGTGSWTIVEKTTGLQPGKTLSKTKAEAIILANKNIETFGRDKLARAIETADKLNVEHASTAPAPKAAKKKIVSVEDITGRDGRGMGLMDGFSIPIKSVITPLLVKGKRLFGVQRGLPDIVFKGEREKTGMMAAAGMRAKFLARDLDSAIGSLPSSTNELEILKNVNSALHGDSSIDDLPIELRAATRALRDHIDSMSEELKPYVGETLQATISANKNIYMNRSFRLYDDPKWGEKVREKFPQLMTQMRDAFMADDPTLTKDVAEGMVAAILEDNGPAGEQRFASTGQIGGRDASILMKRKELSEPFRALIGEYKDWKVNYLRTIFKTSKLIAQSKINRQMADEGMGTIFFDEPTDTHSKQINKERFENAVGRNKGNIELALSQNQDMLDVWLGEMRLDDQMGVPFNQLSPDAEVAVKGRIKRIAESQAKAEHPLDNLYTTPEIAEAIALYQAPQSSEAWLRYLRLFMGQAKVAATVYSVQTGQRNILSNIGVMTSQGYTDVGQFKKSVQALLTDLGAKKDSELREQMIEYARLHIIGESVNAGELREAIKAGTVNNTDFEDFARTAGGPVSAGNVITPVLKKVGRGALWYYKWGDDFFKIYVYENELKSLRESYAGTKSEEEMKREAAEITSAVVPTSSLAPEIVKMIASNPAFGGFVTFHAEILRTQVNTTLRAAHELKTPMFRKRGAKRLAGQILTYIALASISTAARALLGMKKQDEDDARRFVAPWSRNSSIALLRKDGPTISFIDLGYLNPFAIIHKPIMAAYKGLSEGDIRKAGYDAMTEFFEPLLGDGILSQKMKDVWSNHIEQSGKFVANPELPFASRQAETVKYIAPIFIPATARTIIPKIYRAINKIPEKSGVVLDPTTEVIAAMGGQRVTTLNINKQIGYKARDAQRRYENARQIFIEKANSRGAITAKDLQLAYSKMNNAVIDIRSELRKDVSAAVRQGVPNAIVMDAIKKANTDKNLYDNQVGFEDRLTKVNISEYQKTIPGREKLIRDALPIEAVRDQPGKLPRLRL